MSEHHLAIDLLFWLEHPLRADHLLLILNHRKKVVVAASHQGSSEPVHVDIRRDIRLLLFAVRAS